MAGAVATVITALEQGPGLELDRVTTPLPPVVVVLVLVLPLRRETAMTHVTYDFS